MNILSLRTSERKGIAERSGRVKSGGERTGFARHFPVGRNAVFLCERKSNRQIGSEVRRKPFPATEKTVSAFFVFAGIDGDRPDLPQGEDMSRFRNLKRSLRIGLESEDWEERIVELDGISPRELTGPLFACLPLAAPVRDRAAEALGRAVARMAGESREEARNVVRRFMWHMNEESGNIGWGIPEAFGAVLAHNRKLAEEFGPILISYIRNTGKDDNFCDHAVLRRSCFAAVDRLLQAWPDFAGQARAPLQAGLLDEDSVCRELARNTLDRIGLF